MKFHGPLEIRDTGTGKHGRQVYRLIKPLVFGGRQFSGYGLLVCVPAGFETDFASVPRLLWWIFPPAGKWSRAAVVHDYLCERKQCSRFMADAIFREAMRALGVPRWRRVLMYYAVRAYSMCRGLR